MTQQVTQSAQAGKSKGEEATHTTLCNIFLSFKMLYTKTHQGWSTSWLATYGGPWRVAPQCGSQSHT